MGRPTIIAGQTAPRLTPRQREMLRLTVRAGGCTSLTPAVFHAAWTVRAGQHGGIEREFCQTTGDGLLRLGVIEPIPDSKPPCVREHGDLFVMRRYKPTERGMALIGEQAATVGVDMRLP
jgi:hypothetical protein